MKENTDKHWDTIQQIRAFSKKVAKYIVITFDKALKHGFWFCFACLPQLEKVVALQARRI